MFKTNSNLIHLSNILLKLKIINYSSDKVIFSFLNFFLNEKNSTQLKKIYINTIIIRP